MRIKPIEKIDKNKRDAERELGRNGIISNSATPTNFENLLQKSIDKLKNK